MAGPCPARLSDPGASARVRVTCKRGRSEGLSWEFSFNFLTRFDVRFLETLTQIFTHKKRHSNLDQD